MEHLGENESSSPAKPIRIYMDGCFDFTHFGHYNAIRQAKALGDELVVGISSDAEVAKFKRPPVYPGEERCRLIRAVKWVTEVVEDAPYLVNPEILDKYGCDFSAHGDDMAFGLDGRDAYESTKRAGRYKEFKRTVGVSTTDLVNRILRRIEQINVSGTTAAELVIETGLSSNALDSMIGTIARRHSKFTNHHADPDRTSQCEESNEVNNSSATQSPATRGMAHLPHVLQLTQFIDSGVFKSTPNGIRDPQPGETVVYAPGTFDLFHAGHLSFIEKCLELGSYLIIGLYSDAESCFENRRLGPIMTLQERLLNVLSFRGISNVIIGASYHITDTLLDHFKVDVVAFGFNSMFQPTADGKDPMQVPKSRGILRQIESGSLVTTTSVIQRIFQHHEKYAKKNQEKEAKEYRAALLHQQ